jgi:hypothetical protein
MKPELALAKLFLALSIIAALLATEPPRAQADDHAADAGCAEPINATGARPRDYHAILQSCVNHAGARKLATRRMALGGEALLLAVDPGSLATSLERARCWRCTDTSDAAEADTRFMRALKKPEPDPATPDVLENAGLSHGEGEGVFLTGDLCPSRHPLDRDFLEQLARQGPGTPVALAISGLWIAHHADDLGWLKQQAASGALNIVWVNHSYHHPYVKSRPDAQTYLLTPGVDIDAEIFDTERLMIANGLTPSAFFRFPGLVSDAGLMDRLRERHLVALGADSWLALGPRPRPGSIVLVHPNGNEEAGLRIFSRLTQQGKMPRPFRALNEAP